MKTKSFMTLALFIVFACLCQTASAQFQIKIPKLKIKKPKTEQPKTEQPNTDGGNSSTQSDSKQSENLKAQGQSRTEYLAKPEPNNIPKLLLETLEIKARNEERYWKAPSQNDNTSWFPQITFDVFYDFSSKLRYTAEWLNPDGSLWFSEPLDMFKSTSVSLPTVRSPNSSEQLNSKAVVAAGTYGLKITNSKTNEVVFQGKFKVNKLPLDPKLKNKVLFYVDNDWHLPIGYVGFNENFTDYEVRTRPTVFFWFKGVPDSDQFEAQLHYNNQQIASTDKAGRINKYQDRGEHCFLARETCAHGLWGFEWENFLLDNSPSARINNPNAHFTKDKPGEYTVKIFHKGVQVRETKFTVDAKGWIAPNAFSKQIPMTNYKIAVPVKIIGNLDKWNPAAWKTDAFYGNPLTGFNVP